MPETDVSLAQQYGKAAFAAGLPCASARDALFTRWLYSVAKQPGTALPLLAAWLRGWTTANLAPPQHRPSLLTGD